LKERVKKIFPNIEEKIDAILIQNSNEPFIDDNFFYVSGLKNGIFEGCAAVLFPDGEIDLIVSELESEIASSSKSNLLIYKTRHDFESFLKKSLKGLVKIGVNFSKISFNDMMKLRKIIPDIEVFDTSLIFLNMRMIKDSREIESIKKACIVSDMVMDKIPDLIHENINESELAAEINYLLIKNGANKPAFDTISSFGKNTAKPHYNHGDTKLRAGDFVLCDFGANVDKYNSDITRTFIFGNANGTQKKIFETVLEAQNVAFNSIKQGVCARSVHKTVEDFINKTEFKGRFIHSTGHSLGLMVHDGGITLSSENNTIVKENMVLTVEPGIYIPGYGGVRIEDDILIKKETIEVLTKSSKILKEI
jgi:Xaa-Pro dipeptidase